MKFKKDELGNRMKLFYENRTRIYLPRKTNTIIRIDGKAFHSYVKGLKRPFDEGLISDMNETACFLCKNIQGAKLAFVQSDEISILLTDFDTLTTDAWFDGNVQKIVSVSASMATSKFNQLRWMRYINERYNNTTDEINWEWFEGIRKLKLAEFDARVFTIPSKTEVINYFVWRQKDCVRNSIQSVAQSLYSHSELNNKNTSELQEMIWKKGINWNDYDSTVKRGRIIFKETYEIVPDNDLKDIPSVDNTQTTIRSRWIIDGSPDFVKNSEYLNSLIPDLS